MPFKKGQSGNPKGRKLGTTNKSIEGIRKFYKDFVEKNVQGIQDNYDKLSQKEQLQFLLDISEYVLPKLSRSEIVGEVKLTDIEVDID